MNNSASPFLQVNDQKLSGQDLFHLVVLSEQASLIDQLIAEALIDQECDQRQIRVEKDEVTSEINAFRKGKRLFTSAEMIRWIEESGLTDERFQQLMQAQARRKKLKKAITQGQVEKYFALEKWRFDAAVLYLIRVSYRSAADELMSQIEEGTHFFELARKFSEDKGSAPSCGYLGKVRREKLRPELESEIFKAEEGSIVGPIETVDGYHIYLVERIEFAHPSAEILLEIEDKIFASWLKEKTDTADVSFTS